METSHAILITMADVGVFGTLRPTTHTQRSDGLHKTRAVVFEAVSSSREWESKRKEEGTDSLL